MRDSQSLIPNPDLDAEVRRHDEDRWLASRFAPTEVRARLVAIYAVNHEIARTADVVTQPALGDIRLAWWREALVELAAGKEPRAHPTLQAFTAAARHAALSFEAWERLIEARARDFEAEPFATWVDLETYVDATAGGVMRLAIAACGDKSGACEPLVRAAAQAWGCVGLLRAEAHWRARGRSWSPREGGGAEALRARAESALAQMRAERLPAQVFPAIGYVALAPMYLRALARGRGELPLLQRQFKLIAAAATGRV